MQNGILLCISHALEVIRLHTVLAEHRHLGGLVLAQEIVRSDRIAFLFLSDNVGLPDGVDLLSLVSR